MVRIKYHSAGGILVRDDRVLILRKRAKSEWVLPRGRVERDETLEAAALRETREETGYPNLRVTWVSHRFFTRGVSRPEQIGVQWRHRIG